MWLENFFFSFYGYHIFASLFRTFFLWCYSLKEELTSNQFLLTSKRVKIYAILFFVLPALVIWNHIGFFLDNIFFPKWKKTEVKTPMFVIGNARSGTTWFHRVLTESNPQTFTTFHTWEILFAVSISWKYLFHYLYTLDQTVLFGYIYSWIQSKEKSLFGWIDVHAIGLSEAEEDEWLMLHIGLCQLSLFFFPTAEKLFSRLILFDYHPDMLSMLKESLQLLQNQPGNASHLTMMHQMTQFLSLHDRHMLSRSHRYRLFSYYKQCIQRHLYFYSHLNQQKPLIFVAKNPTFTLRIPSIHSVFPDARIVCLVRNPLESVPSMISYISQVWHAFTSPVKDYPEAKLLFSFCEAHYLFPLLYLDHTLTLTQNPTTRQIVSSVGSLHGYASNTSHHMPKGIFVSYHHLRRDLTNQINLLMNYLFESQTNQRSDWFYQLQLIEAASSKIL